LAKNLNRLEATAALANLFLMVERFVEQVGKRQSYRGKYIAGLATSKAMKQHEAFLYFTDRQRRRSILVCGTSRDPTSGSRLLEACNPIQHFCGGRHNLQFAGSPSIRRIEITSTFNIGATV